jgi:hypothetical protein
LSGLRFDAKIEATGGAESRNRRRIEGRDCSTGDGGEFTL